MRECERQEANQWQYRYYVRQVMAEAEVAVMLAEIFKPYMEQSPVSVMVRGSMERLLSRAWIEEVFEESAQDQYTRELLFSSVFGLTCQVVLGRYKSIHAAYMPQMDEIGVSLTSVYNKLNGVSTQTSAALVQRNAADCAEIIESMGGGCQPWLPGYRVRILDGNCIEATEHRLAVLRQTGSGALPGKSLVVYDPELGCVIDVVACQDGHAQERSLLGSIEPMIKPGDLWIADRNFCCRGFMETIAAKPDAFFLFRHHKGLVVSEAGKRRKVGTSATGKLFEQKVEVAGRDGAVIELRQVTIELSKATRDGETRLQLLTNLPSEVTGKKIAELYAGRWRIETAFQQIERDLNSEINTLGYPQAALFCFCVAVIAYNLFMLVHAALRAAHGEKKIAEEFSNYYLAEEIAAVHMGMMIAVPAQQWCVFAEMDASAFATLLRSLADNVQLARFKKHKRGPKKPSTRPKADPRHPHVSTAKLIAARLRK